MQSKNSEAKLADEIEQAEALGLNPYTIASIRDAYLGRLVDRDNSQAAILSSGERTNSRRVNLP
jgi:hypothetical protein